MGFEQFEPRGWALTPQGQGRMRIARRAGSVCGGAHPGNRREKLCNAVAVSHARFIFRFKPDSGVSG